MNAPLLRNLTAAELPAVLDWAAAEGWNPGLEDAAAFHAADPGGFFVAEVAGKPAAAIAVVNHAPDYAFLGLYLCRPAFRGQGIGYALWQHALAHAGGRCIGLDGVAAQQANYARSGFVRTGATTRYEGSLAAARDAQIGPPGADDLAAALALDHAANGVARQAFMTAWLRDTPTRRSLVWSDRGQITGLVTIRRCVTGVKIGPLIAPDAGVALRLAGAALAVLPAPQVALDLPDQSAELAGALRDRGFAAGFATARMYRGPAPVSGPALQAIATMELG